MKEISAVYYGGWLAQSRHPSAGNNSRWDDARAINGELLPIDPPGFIFVYARMGTYAVYPTPLQASLQVE